jgi:cell division protein FtsQ
VQRRTVTARPRRRTASGLPVEGVLRPRATSVVRRTHRGAWAALTAVLMALIFLTVLLDLGRSSFFKVSRVDVTGATTLDRAAVVSDAGVLGRPIYTIDTGAVETVLRRLPAIQQVHVRRSWPNKIAITVQERKPWGTWQIGGVNYLIADDGTVLDIVPAPQLVTIFERDAAPGLRPGERVDPDAVRTAELLVDELPQTVAQQVTRLEYSTEDGLTLLTDQGVQVRLGDGQDLEYKLAVWQALDAKVGAQNIRLLDLRSVDRPYYR